MDKLKQKRLLNENQFELADKGLLYKCKSLAEYVELTIPYEEITKEITVVKKGSKNWLFTGIIFLLIAFSVLISRLSGESVESSAEIIWLIVALACFSVFLLKYKNNRNIICTDGKAICFYQDKPNKETLDLFIESLYKKRNEYLKDKYTKIDLDFPAEQYLYRIQWLRDEGIINDIEFNEIKTKIMEGKKESNSNFGFKTE